MKKQRLDAPIFEFWYLVGDDLRQHLWEFHTQGFIHKGVEADLQETLDHLKMRQRELFRKDFVVKVASSKMAAACSVNVT